MESLSVYLPTDRRHALLRGVDLPSRATGAALFADISGFTSLTEALVRALGPQRGAEELPRQLNIIYDALVAEIDRYAGSVISFSGDAVTCWFDNATPGAPAHARACACAFAMQQAMQQFANVTIPGVGSVAIAIKIAVATGRARRFVVGDPDIQTIDVLGGEILNRLADAEHHARRGEVLIDEQTHATLGDLVVMQEWHDDEETGQRFAVISGMPAEVAPAPLPAIPAGAIDRALLSRWLLPPVFERLASGNGEFLTELRPAVALFLRFSGIDYDNDEQAQPKLDAFIRWVQGVLVQYDGFLLQLTVGDKGSYLYAAFGAPLAHEDDVARALRAALELRQSPFDSIGAVQIGISFGRTRTGAYGGVTRRTYGGLGDEVNMAARLMQHAQPGQVIVSPEAQKTAPDIFVWRELTAMQVKGKTAPITPLLLLGVQERQMIHLHEARYTRRMVGRRAELAAIADKRNLALLGAGQIIGITGEAGMGKSRLLYEVINQAHAAGFASHGGECQSYGTNTNYLVWRGIWQRFFGLNPQQPLEEQIATLHASLAEIDPLLLPRLPLLGAVLNIPIADNTLTSTFDAKLRKVSLEATLVECLRARSRHEPLLLVLEDCHWLDPLSHDLLEVVGRAIADMPVLLLLAYRPLQMQRLAVPRVTELSHFSEIALGTLPPDEIEQLVREKLAQLYGDHVEVLPDLVAQITERTQGNPFYVEELLNYLRDREIDPQQPGAIQRVDLPASLHSLILSRIDRLTENQRTLLKVASVIGRQFPAAMLWSIPTFFGAQERLRLELESLATVELTVQDRPDPDLAYLFKHIITQEVAYESLPYATRSVLHEQIGQYFEQSFPEEIGHYIDLLAYHFDRTQNDAKRRTYLLQAGDTARATYANQAALDYYERVLPLIPQDERYPVLLNLGQVLEVVGQWAEAQNRYNEALAIAEQASDQSGVARCHALLGELLRKQGHYAQALVWLEQARWAYVALDDKAGQAQVLHFCGSIAMQQGDYATAHSFYEASLYLRRAEGDTTKIASLLSNLSILAYHQGDVDGAWALCRESLELRREQGSKLWIANSLGNLGMLALEAGNFADARVSMEEALVLEREVGDRSAIAISLNNLGSVARELGEYDRAYTLYRESLVIARDLGDAWSLCYLFEDVGCLLALQQHARLALLLCGAAAALRESINAPLSPPEEASLERKLEASRQMLGPEAASVWDEGKALEMNAAVALALTNIRAV